jgi:hypothetical protein
LADSSANPDYSDKAAGLRREQGEVQPSSGCDEWRRNMISNKWCICVVVLPLVASCGPSHGYQADYTYEVIKRAADGSTQVVGRGKSERTMEGDAGGCEVQGIGPIATGIGRIDKDKATIPVTYPDKTTSILELRPKDTKEVFHKSGEYGVRVTLAEIRGR